MRDPTVEVTHEIAHATSRMARLLLVAAIAATAVATHSGLTYGSTAVQALRRIPTPLLLAKAKAKKSKRPASTSSRPAARGFGTSPEQAELNALEKIVERLLKENNGDVRAAHEAHFAAGIERLRTEDPTRYATMAENNATGVLSLIHI